MSNYDLIALERNNGKIVAVHHIEQPDWDGKGFYRATLTGGAFKYSEMRRRFGKKPPWNHKPLIRWFSVQQRAIWEQEESITNKVMNGMGITTYVPEYYGAHVIRHENIWDFYKAIGYDYKRKRYTR